MANTSNKNTASKLTNQEKKKRKILALIRKGNKLHPVSPADGLMIGHQAEKLARKSRFQAGKALANLLIGTCHYRLTNCNAALRHLFDSLEWFKRTFDKKNESEALYFIGSTYVDLGDYLSALEYQLEALKIREENGNEGGMALSLNMLGSTYYSLNEFEKSQKFIEESIEINEKTNNQSLKVMNYNNLGMVYTATEQFEKAEQTYHEGLELMKDDKNEQEFKANYLGNIGHMYIQRNDHDKALEYTERALNIFINIKSMKGRAIAMLNIADILIRMNDKDRALKYLHSALKITKENNLKEILFHVHNNLYAILREKGEFIKALEHHEEYHKLKSEVDGRMNSERSKSLQIKHDLEKNEKEKEIYRLKNVELVELNDEIERQNKNITDGIRYAQKIQEAILPKKELLSNFIKDSFILFKPRDYVSGDFYWFTSWNQSDGRLLKKKSKGLKAPDFGVIAAVDCTGHGVPGAFLSIIGNELLNDIVLREGVTTPSEVLDQLQDGLMAALKKEDQESMAVDGMDIGICTIDYVNKKLNFSAAGRPLILIRDDELQTFKGRKLPIGLVLSFPMPFKSTEIDIKNGDCFYLFSDGFCDQFGGKERKKFMMQRFHDLLLKIHHESMEKQQEILTKTMTKWMGNHEQIDDILVLGFRI